MKGSTLLLAALLAFLIAAGTGALTWHSASRPVEPEASTMAFTVPAGASSRQIARVLQEQGIIRSAKAMRLYLRLRGLGGKIRSGE